MRARARAAPAPARGRGPDRPLRDPAAHPDGGARGLRAHPEGGDRAAVLRRERGDLARRAPPLVRRAAALGARGAPPEALARSARPGGARERRRAVRSRISRGCGSPGSRSTAARSSCSSRESGRLALEGVDLAWKQRRGTSEFRLGVQRGELDPGGARAGWAVARLSAEGGARRRGRAARPHPLRGRPRRRLGDRLRADRAALRPELLPRRPALRSGRRARPRGGGAREDRGAPLGAGRGERPPGRPDAEPRARRQPDRVGPLQAGRLRGEGDLRAQGPHRPLARPSGRARASRTSPAGSSFSPGCRCSSRSTRTRPSSRGCSTRRASPGRGSTSSRAGTRGSRGDCARSRSPVRPTSRSRSSSSRPAPTTRPRRTGRQMLRFAQGRVSGPVRILSDRVEFPALEVSSGKSRVSASVVLHYASEQGLSVAARGEPLDLSDFGEVAGFATRGVGQVAGRRRGAVPRREDLGEPEPARPRVLGLLARRAPGEGRLPARRAPLPLALGAEGEEPVLRERRAHLRQAAAHPGRARLPARPGLGPRRPARERLLVDRDGPGRRRRHGLGAGGDLRPGGDLLRRGRGRALAAHLPRSPPRRRDAEARLRERRADAPVGRALRAPSGRPRSRGRSTSTGRSTTASPERACSSRSCSGSSARRSSTPRARSRSRGRSRATRPPRC